MTGGREGHAYQLNTIPSQINCNINSVFVIEFEKILHYTNNDGPSFIHLNVRSHCDDNGNDFSDDIVESVHA